MQQDVKIVFMQSMNQAHVGKQLPLNCKDESVTGCYAKILAEFMLNPYLPLHSK